jgi:Coenzyme PQQ synthesis protein D (PqqD)
VTAANTYLARNDEVAARLFEGEMIVLSPHGPTMFTLNEVATIIWQAADGSTSLHDIVVAKICAEYDVTLDEALADASQLADELARHGILLVSNEPIQPAAADGEGNGAA